MVKPETLIPQTIQKGSPKFLRQGSIFDIQKVVFKGTPDDLKKYGKDEFSFRDFYPYCEYEPGFVKGIVINQSCDLVIEDGRSPKIPYINVCLVESLGSILHLSLRSNKQWGKCLHVDDLEMGGNKTRVKLVTADFLKKFKDLSDKFKEIINNNHSWAFFIIFDDGGAVDIRGVNLTKIFPVRIDHYKDLLGTVTHELETQFENKLGWKLAELYGRVGTRDYSDKEVEYLTDLIHKNLAESFKDFKSVPDSEFTKLKSKLDLYKKDPKVYVADLEKLYEDKTI